MVSISHGALQWELQVSTLQDYYQETNNNVDMHHTRILHHLPVDKILTWTKMHLDAYLATDEVILEQNVDLG